MKDCESNCAAPDSSKRFRPDWVHFTVSRRDLGKSKYQHSKNHQYEVVIRWVTTIIGLSKYRV